jgi:fucose 4-O-acetylase-like acetyltransferase
MPTLLTCFRNRRVLTGRRRRSKVREWRDMHRKWQTQTGHFVRAFYTTQIFETFIFRFYRPFNDMTCSYSQNLYLPKIYWRIKNWIWEGFFDILEVFLRAVSFRPGARTALSAESISLKRCWALPVFDLIDFRMRSAHSSVCAQMALKAIAARWTSTSVHKCRVATAAGVAIWSAISSASVRVAIRGENAR